VTDLERRVLLARAAGEDAAAATRQLALRNNDPHDRGDGRGNGLGRWLSSAPPVTADQIMSTNRTIESFAAAIREVNALLDADRQIDTFDDVDLAASDRDVAALHNRINATLAALEHLRIHLILDP
jgi:hypothetical protein